MALKRVSPSYTALPNIQTVHNDGTKEDVIGAGVETTFEVLTVLKGERGTNALALHHFTLADPKPMISGPQLVSFVPKASLHSATRLRFYGQTRVTPALNL